MDKKFLLASISVAVIVFHSIIGYFVRSPSRTITTVTIIIDVDTLQIPTGERVRLLELSYSYP
jgi:hypothetical protein